MKLIGEHASDWEDYIDPVLFSIRTSIQESTKFTPFFLMHGREAKFPLEAEKSTSTCSELITEEDVQERIDRMRNLKDSIFPAAKENIDSSQKKQKEQYRKRKGIVKTSIRVDDLVLRMNMKKRTKKGHKMEDTWLGPYKVLQISDKGSCLLLCLKTEKEIKHKVNVSQLKLYKGEMKKKMPKSKIPKIKSHEVEPKTITHTLQPRVLQDQLFDSSILRLWRTGAEFEAEKNLMEDDLSYVRMYTAIIICTQ